MAAISFSGYPENLIAATGRSTYSRRLRPYKVNAKFFALGALANHSHRQSLDSETLVPHIHLDHFEVFVLRQ